jgi:3-phenylpropionate/trans-cinnamate dioxygenase ferredoxin reductase subunit
VGAQAPILIIGAGQAGVQTAEALRTEGYDGELLLIGSETHPPYQRPPLSKKWLIEPGNKTSLALRGAEALARIKINLKLDALVAGIDRSASQLVFADGTACALRARSRSLPDRSHGRCRWQGRLCAMS